MTLVSIKKIEKQILQKTIPTKSYMIYAFITIGTIIQLFKTSRYPVNVSAYNVATLFNGVILLIKIAKYSICYNIIKNENITEIAYAIIPLEAVISIKYFFFLTIPLIVISYSIIRHFKLDYNYWNVINSQIITIIYLMVNTFKYTTSLNRIVKKVNSETSFI